ncbi:hypothetical protein AB1Y20_005051 [Prymnesium parvum]|uniref:PH domain-containing protein n=1 Tax=Prymnesium parvum TaxID=97485 RepID=A0AB34J4T5_PRYPA
MAGSSKKSALRKRPAAGKAQQESSLSSPLKPAVTPRSPSPIQKKQPAPPRALPDGPARSVAPLAPPPVDGVGRKAAAALRDAASADMDVVASGGSCSPPRFSCAAPPCGLELQGDLIDFDAPPHWADDLSKLSCGGKAAEGTGFEERDPADAPLAPEGSATLLPLPPAAAAPAASAEAGLRVDRPAQGLFPRTRHRAQRRVEKPEGPSEAPPAEGARRDARMREAAEEEEAERGEGGARRGAYGSVAQYDLEEEMEEWSWEGVAVDVEESSSEEWEAEEWSEPSRQWTDAELTVFSEAVLREGPLTAVYASAQHFDAPAHGLLQLADLAEGWGGGHAAAAAAALPEGTLATLQLGAMLAPLRGWRTPVLRWLPATPPRHADGALDFFMLPALSLAAAAPAYLCFSLSSVASPAQRDLFVEWLSQRTSILLRTLPDAEWDGFSTVPSVDELQSEWAVAGVHRSSVALQRAMLASARLVAASCSAVSSSVASAAARTERLPRPMLKSASTRRLRHGLEITRTSLQHVSAFSDCVGRAVLQSGTHAALLTGRALEMIARDEHGAPSRAAELWRDNVHEPLASIASSISSSIPPASKATLARAVSASGGALLAVADSAALAKGLVYVSVRKASADIADCFLGPEAGDVVVEGLDTLAVMQSTVSNVAMHGVGRILAASDSAALANKLVYVGLKRGSSQAVAKRFGAAAGLMTADGFENIATHGRLSGAVTLNSVGWALSAVHNQPPPRILTSTVRHPPPDAAAPPPPDAKAADAAAPTPAPSAAPSEPQLPPRPTIPAPRPPADGAPREESRGGKPAAAGKKKAKEEGAPPPALAAEPRAEVSESSLPPPAEAKPADGKAAAPDDEEFDDLSLREGDAEGEDVWLLLGLPWREGFLALLVDGDDAPPPHAAAAAPPHDGARAAAARRTWQRVWCVVQDSAVALFDHKYAAECPSRAPVAEIDWRAISAIGLEPRHIFTLSFADGSAPLILRAQDVESCEEWVSCLTRLVCWRAIRVIQRECAPEWEDVAVLSNDELTSAP